MNKAFRKSLVALMASTAAGVFCQAAQAQSSEVYAAVGTDGVGAGYGYALNSMFGVRGEVDGFSLSHNFSSGGVNYNGTFSMVHGAVYGDFFPMPSVFPIRLTVGALIGDDELDGTASGATYSFNGVTVPTNGESVRATLKYPEVRPYLGFGFGHHLGARGFSVAFDAGVAYGKPSVSLDVPSNVAA